MKQTPISQSIRLKPETYHKLKQLADNEDRSFNKYAVRILEEYISDFEKKHGPITFEGSE